MKLDYTKKHQTLQYSPIVILIPSHVNISLKSHSILVDKISFAGMTGKPATLELNKKAVLPIGQ